MNRVEIARELVSLAKTILAYNPRQTYFHSVDDALQHVADSVNLQKNGRYMLDLSTLKEEWSDLRAKEENEPPEFYKEKTFSKTHALNPRNPEDTKSKREKRVYVSLYMMPSGTQWELNFYET